MKPNPKSPFFVLSLLFVVFFVAQAYVEGKLVKHAILNNKPIGFVEWAYWLGLLWLSVAAMLFYKATRLKQTVLRQLLVFIIAPFAFAPLAAIVYVILVLLPTYGLASSNSFTH